MSLRRWRLYRTILTLVCITLYVLYVLSVSGDWGTLTEIILLGLFLGVTTTGVIYLDILKENEL